MEKIKNKFASVNGTYSVGLNYLKRTIAVYNALKQEKEPVRPIELAEHMGNFLWGGKVGDYFSVTHPLHWLEEMGMVAREEHEETITIELWVGSGHYETITKIIDGVEFTAKKWVEGPQKKVVKYYKWYAI